MLPHENGLLVLAGAQKCAEKALRRSLTHTLGTSTAALLHAAVSLPQRAVMFQVSKPQNKAVPLDCTETAPSVPPGLSFLREKSVLDGTLRLGNKNRLQHCRELLLGRYHLPQQ